MPEVKRGWVILSKFGKHEHLDEFRRAGLLYMNPSRRFSESELLEDDVRGDQYEGTDCIYQPTEIKRVTFAPKSGPAIEIKSESFTGPLLVSFGGRRACNVFCMYAIKTPPKRPLADERNYGFGNSFIVVLNTQEFINRFAAAAEAARYQWSCDCVAYYDCKTYSGDTGPFRKPSTYAYQSEFRCIVRPGSNSAVRLSLGSLTDITTPLFSLSWINDLVEFDLDTAEQAQT